MSPTLIHSPTRTDCSIWRASPAITLPSVSWNERPTTAVSTVEVAMRPERLRPAREARVKMATSDAPATRTSVMMRGGRTPTRGRTPEKRRRAVTPMIASASKMSTARRASA